MAVSANLSVAQELKDAFLGSLDGSQRFIIVAIKAEVLSLAHIEPSSGDEAADFSKISEHVMEHEPSFILFRRDVEGKSDDRPWALISYVPETAKVRRKMLYASSKKHMLKKLGASLFADDEFYVGEAADLTYEGFQETHRQQTEAERQELLTAEEVAAQFEEVAVDIEVDAPINKSKSGGVPFVFDADVTQALKDFAAGARTAVEIKIHPKKETCQLGDLAGDTAQADLAAAIVKDAPRFYLLSYGGQTVFVYCCPELSKVRSRMVYSTCKAAVIATAKECGVAFTKTTEIREPEEVSDAISAPELPEAAEPAATEVKRATRKTRGKRRLNKKIKWT